MKREEILTIAKPILFNTEMVRAIQNERKTETRRAIKPQPLFYTGRKYIFADDVCPKKWKGCSDFISTYQYQPGDYLYVRETWGDYSECKMGGAGYFVYRADYPDGTTTAVYSDGTEFDLPRWHPSIQMPKEAARIFLRITDVRVERLQDIDNAGALKEGCDGRCSEPADGALSDCQKDYDFSVEKFESVWDSTIKPADRDKYGWNANPFVWVIEFERVRVEDV